MSNENSTLTEAELENCKPVGGEGGQVKRAFCPFHGGDKQRSLRVNYKTGHFNCFQCGAWGYMDWARSRWRTEQGVFDNEPSDKVVLTLDQIRNLFRETRSRIELRKNTVSLPKEFKPITTKINPNSLFAKSYIKARKYLRSRGIDRELWRKYDIRICYKGTYAGRVIIPIVMEGMVRGWVGRAVSKYTQNRYRNSSSDFSDLIFNLDYVQSSTVIICEGIFDALTVGSNNAVSVFGKKLSEEQRKKLSKFDRKIIFFDSDAFDEATDMARIIGAEIAIIPQEFLSRDGSADPSSLGKLRCADILNNHVFPVGDPELIAYMF